jgi:hypothetical protein
MRCSRASTDRSAPPGSDRCGRPNGRGGAAKTQDLTIARTPALDAPRPGFPYYELRGLGPVTATRLRKACAEA